MTITFTQAELQKAASEIAEWYGLVIPTSIVETIFKGNLALLDGFSDQCGFDTIERSRFVNALLTDILDVNLQWPINADSQETVDHFYKTIKELAPKFGIGVRF